jgi:hypothetical protein
MEHPIAHSPNGAGHEKREVDVRFIVVSLIVLLIGTFLACLLVVGIFQFFHTTYKPDVAAKESPQVIPPEPRIEEKPWQQLITVRAREDHVLNSYAWVDQKEGTVRVPIDRAIDLLSQKGLPSHDYLQDILAGRKPPAARPPDAGSSQGSRNAK